MYNHRTRYIDHGICIEHDRCCPIHPKESAVYNMDLGIFEPSWRAQKEGYFLIKIKPVIVRHIIKILFSVKRR